MAVEHKLDRVLRHLGPKVRDGRWVFVLFDRPPPFDLVIVASIQEEEGLSAVIAQRDADRLGLSYDFVAGWIECSVHSSLSAIGVTGAIAGALGRASIPCNAVAGIGHDHLFVPIEQREDALAVLDELAGLRAPRASGPKGPATHDLPEVLIRDAEIRLGQFLKLAGLVDSGAAVKPLLAYGRVQVDGETETRRGRQLHVGDVVTVDGRSVAVGSAQHRGVQ
ncbi:MAG TPA: ACT domain-containing protein [Acidimicrobiales bacterium]|jgi:hypothetical protein|nr:ACT domain-containing protein [Acidimicrobiales bacterium]